MSERVGEPRRLEVTQYFNRFLETRDPDTFRALVEEYWPRIARYVESRGRLRDGATDGQDVALSVLRLLHLRAAAGTLHPVAARWQLWSELQQLARQSIYDRNEKAGAAKRDPGVPIQRLPEGAGDLSLAAASGSSRDGIDPRVAAEMHELITKLFDRLRGLEDPIPARFAEMLLLGYSRSEICAELGIGDGGPYDRKLKTIQAACQAAVRDLP